MLVKQAFIQLQPIPLSKTALKEKRIVPVDPDFRYLRFKAIGNLEVSKPRGGFNGNIDGFPVKYFEDDEPGYGYKSFIGKRAHYEHNSSLGKKGSIGDLPDAYLNRFVYPEGISGWKDLDGSKFAKQRQEILDTPNQKDGSIEVLMKIDTSLLHKKSVIEPKTLRGLERLVRMIDSGQRISCSMGTNVQYSTCSTCGNEAKFASDYCDHLTRGRKGALTIVTANQVRDLLDKDKLRPEWLKHVVASQYDIDEILKGSSNKGVAVINGEINHKLSFFELSVVGTPAYEIADALEKIASKVEGDYEQYLKQVRAELGDNVLVDLYSLLQQDGIISTGCEVKGW
ncbi:MAG: hypothetical protein WC346_21805 [Methanogenium sp.]|jgi:hypothetical protein